MDVTTFLPQNGKKCVPVMVFDHTKGCEPLTHKIKVLLKFSQLFKINLDFLSPCYVFSLLQSIYVFSLIFNMFLNALHENTV